MKKSIINNKPVAAGLLFLVIAFTANAQKLPNVQQTNLRAPSNIKIDGKTTEWNNQFQAYNHATDIFYTISNDDHNLYLTVQATDPQIINKIIGGGITFTIQKSGKKNDQGGISITYPLFDKKNRPYLGNRMQMSSANKGDLGSGNTIQVVSVRMDGKPEAAPAPLQGDSVMNVNNKRLADNSKFIGVTGIAELDTLISVYNTDGIKTAELFDNKMAYTYELAIDFKNLGLAVNEPPKFAYHITINGSSRFNITSIKFSGGDGSEASNAGIALARDNIMAQLETLNGQASPTDFWGEYKLVKP